MQRKEYKIIEHIWIEMSDGIKLSAKIWFPKTNKPVPGILEFIPYRKRDSYAMRDHRNHTWFAERGYVCVRPDMRGHGDSEGIMLDEYSEREQQDTVEVIEWISCQKWCDGNVGMMGLSWGGIASMQAAIRQPDALKAIIPVGISVDRYYDDGGYLVGGYPGQGLGWGGVMFGYCARPPDPKVVGNSWRNMWFERLEKTPMFLEKWLTHQLRDETWVHGSVCENYDKIRTPTLGISGWNDCWPNTVLRLIKNIKSPCKVVSGAWGHVYPNLGGPGSIGFLQLGLDWWDYWLKGQENGIMDQPAVLAFLQDSHEPDPNPNPRPGRWVGEECWPSQNITNIRYYLHDRALEDKPNLLNEEVIIFSPLSLGLSSGEYMPISGVAELPQDQRLDDSHSICFETETLVEQVDLLGTPYVKLKLSSDCRSGLIAARICDIAPNGASTLMSFGILNLKLRNGRDHCEPIEPDAYMDIKIRLNDLGWSVKKGHRLRLALSNQFWPMAWPLAERSKLKLCLDLSYIDLPVRRLDPKEKDISIFKEAEAADFPSHEVLSAAKGSRTVKKDIKTGEIIFDVRNDGGRVHFKAIDLVYGSFNSQSYIIKDSDPLSARIKYEANFHFSRSNWKVETKSSLVVTSDKENFFLNARLDAFESENCVYNRRWNLKIPRFIY